MTEPTQKQIDEVARAIARVDTRPDIHCSDNVAIAMVSFYEDDRDCPDEPADDESGWKPWALEQEKAVRERMARAAIKAWEKVRAPTPQDPKP